MFEVGPVFLQVRDAVMPQEQVRIGVVLSGRREPRRWQEGESRWADFFDLKGIVTSFLDAFHVKDGDYAPADHPAFAPSRTARVSLGGSMLGWVGQVHPDVLQSFGIEVDTIAAELDWGTLVQKIPAHFHMSPIVQFPAIKEDLAVVVEETVLAQNVASAIQEACGPLLVSISVFDVFRGPQVGTGRKSLAFSLTFQAPDRTLTDADVAAVRRRTLSLLQERFGAMLRR